MINTTGANEGRSCDLTLLFAPTSIAIVGASRDPEKLSGRIVPFLQQYNYAGSIYPINPARSEIAGLRSYASLEDTPEVPDLMMVMLPAGKVVAEVARSVSIGVPFVVVFSSGFDEAGEEGRAKARALAACLEGGHTRLLGPNSEGFVDMAASVPVTFSPVLNKAIRSRPLLRGNVAVISQSGGLGFGIADQAMAAGLGIRAVVSTGNELDLDLADFVAHFASDPETSVIVLFVESLRDAKRFVDVCRLARGNGKHVVAAKVGNTPVGGLAAQAHTGRLATKGGVYEAIFSRAGVIEASDIQELLDLALAFARQQPAAGRRVAILTSSGGGGVWAADQAVEEGLEVPEFSYGLQERLQRHLPPFAATRNPVDITGQAHSFDRDGVVSVMRELLTTEETDALLLVGTFGYDRQLIQHPELPLVLADRSKPLVVFSYTDLQEEAARILERAGVAPYTSARRAARVLGALLRDHEPQELPEAAPQLPAEIKGNLAALLSACGVPVNPQVRTKKVDEAVAAATDLGFPVVLKLLASELQHKTEIGGVITGVKDIAAVRNAFNELEKLAMSTRLASVDIAVERHLYGHELMIGAINDDDAGPVLSLGAGGIFVELARDKKYRLPPISTQAANHWVSELNGFSVLRDGYRHLPPANLTALADLLVGFATAVSSYVRPWQVIELNPVIVSASEATAVDVLTV